MNNTEILAPAGSMESLMSAVNCGADAVYIGGKNFSARQNAVNFDEEEIKQAAEYCHLRGVRLYITVNTILLDSQLSEFAEFVKDAAAAGVDAFIVQDLGAASIIRNTIPDAAIHGSTQMTVHTVNGALFLKEKGFKRVVLARELSKDVIEKIAALDIETEVFVHGALCMSVSGQCYLSSLIGQRSANRGLCAQPCRLPFSACKNPDSTALSLKDLTLTQHLPELQKMGVSSFKIEGRMKRPEYVATAVTACVQALEGHMPDMSLLRSVFSRSGFTDGYFTGNRYDMFGHREKEDVISMAKILPQIRQEYSKEIKTEKIYFKAFIKNAEPVKLIAENGKLSVTVYGDIPEKALKKPVNRDYLERQLSKLGGTVFEYGGLECEIDDGLILTAKAVNALRREAVEELGRKIILANTPTYEFCSYKESFTSISQSFDRNSVRARISDFSQFEEVKQAEFIIMPPDVFLNNQIEDCSKVIIEPDRFIADEQKMTDILLKCREKGVEHLLCNNISYLKTGRDLGYILHGDFSLNVSNSQSMEFLKQEGISDLTLSFEMKLGQINALKKSVSAGIIAYGYLPVMLARNCPVKNEVGCSNCSKSVFDRTGRENKIVCRKNYVEILNSQALYMADRIDELKNVSFITLYFTNESPKEVRKIMKEYKSSPEKHENITRGLYYRGII